jgi:hypothetical protein
MSEVMRHRSSHIDTTEYDYSSETLSVTFTDGRTWQYSNVPRGAYHQFITAPSRGRAFNDVIRDRYDGEEV